MATDQGIDFRATSGYVTDPANCTYCLDEQYPTVRATWTFGWNSTDGSHGRDRDSTVANKSLAGINFRSNSGAPYFQLDIPATGSTDIHAAFGDAGADNDANWIIKDTTTNIVTITKSTCPQLHFMDATNVERTSVANWTSNEAATTYTMASTALRAYPNGANNNVIAFFRAVQSGGGGAALNPQRLMLLGVS